jgi:hypothetical protein
VIRNAIGTADAVVVLIGPRWLDASDAAGRRRLDDPHDLVRQELATALHGGRLVVPVLVDGATMPSTNELPDELAPLARRHALELSPEHWNAGVGRLVSLVEQTRAPPAAPRGPPGVGELWRRIWPRRGRIPPEVAPDSPHDHAQAVSFVMRDVDFAAAAHDLPAVALALAHRADAAAAETLARRIEELERAAMGDRAKVLSLGFAIEEIVGVDVLGAAVQSLGEAIQIRRDDDVRAPRGLELFYSYSHRDEELRDELEKHLTILRRQGVIRDWHDRRITAGTDWEGQIHERLDQSQLILLLISADFLASDYCYDVELERAMARHTSGGARVVPIILRPVFWKGAPFGKLQALPTDAKAVTQYANRDEAFTIVTEGIAEAAAELQHAI